MEGTEAQGSEQRSPRAAPGRARLSGNVQGWLGWDAAPVLPTRRTPRKGAQLAGQQGWSHTQALPGLEWGGGVWPSCLHGPPGARGGRVHSAGQEAGQGNVTTVRCMSFTVSLQRAALRKG